MKTCAENQREYRIRKAAKLERMEAALRSIKEIVATKTSPAAAEIRNLCEEALNGST